MDQVYIRRKGHNWSELFPGRGVGFLVKRERRGGDMDMKYLKKIEEFLRVNNRF